MAPKPDPATTAAAREQRRRNFAEQLSKAFNQDKSTSESKKDSKKPTSVDSNAAASSSSSPLPATPPVLRAAAEALRDFFVSKITPATTSTTTDSIAVPLVIKELFGFVDNPLWLLTPGTIVDHRILRKILLVSNKPPPVTTEERENVCEQLLLRGTLLARMDSLPADFRKVKEALMLAAMADARPRARESDPEGIKFVLNELLQAYGEPNYPFDDLVEFPDPSVPRTGRSCQIALGGRLALLPLRNPQLATVMQDVVQIYINKATVIVGTIKFSPIRRF